MPPSESLRQSKYKLLGLVGHGQFGQVFCAVHRQTRQLVALKNLERQRFPTHQFLRELRFLLSLQHPHIVSCYAIEHTQTGRYLVMDYCEGGTLRSLMEEENHLCLEQSLQVICDILQGLEHAHGRGIVHCDIKPENILLCFKPKGWTAKISDFGIARLSQELSTQGTGNTGSPAYMAPERFYGQYSATSDLYSVGIMLFELLAGYRPFTGAPATLMGAHLNQQVRFPDAVPPAIQPIIQKSLQKLSARRFPSATAMLEALHQAAAELSININSSIFSLDKPLLESWVVPSACVFDASQCDRLPIAPVYLDVMQGSQRVVPPGARPLQPDTDLESIKIDQLDHKKETLNQLPSDASRRDLSDLQPQETLVAYGVADHVGFQLRTTRSVLATRQSQVVSAFADSSGAIESPSVRHVDEGEEGDELAHPDQRLSSKTGVKSQGSDQADQLGMDLDSANNADLETSAAIDPEVERHGKSGANEAKTAIKTARAIASQTLSTLSASVLFDQPIQGIAVRPQGCYVVTQHTLHLLSTHQLCQSEPMAELIHQFEQDCTLAIEKSGQWIATVTDMRQVLPKSGFSTLSFYPLSSATRAPTLAKHPIRLAFAGEASALLQAIALDSRHVAVVSDVPPKNGSTPSSAKRQRSPKAHPGGTYLEVFTRRGQLVGALSLPLLLGQVFATSTPYRFLATDQYDLYSILQIDLKPFRILRFALQIVPQFLVSASWGHIVMNAQGHIILLDQQGCQVNRIEGPANPTAIALVEPAGLFIATQDKKHGRLYTIDLKELGVDILF
ncbi:MAG: serine/threonine-protein kinase [Elainellaceae cyanobacterium]